MATNDTNLAVYLTNKLAWEKYGVKAPVTSSVSLTGNGYLVLALTPSQQHSLCLKFTPPERHEWFLLFYNEEDNLVAKEGIPHSQLALCLHPFGPISAQSTVQDKMEWRSKVSMVLQNWKDYPLDSSEWSNYSDTSTVDSVDGFMASINAKRKRTTKTKSKKSNPSPSGTNGSKDEPF